MNGLFNLYWLCACIMLMKFKSITMERNEIFRKLLNDKHLTQSDFMRKSGLTRSTISDLFTGRRRITGDMVEKFANALGNDVYQYFYGVVVPQIKDTENISTENTNLLPFYDTNFACGKTGGFDMVLEQSKPDCMVSVPNIPLTAETFVVRAYGRSMINRNNPTRSIPEGAMVVLRKNVIKEFQWGEVYALATPNGCIIKKIMPSTEKDCVRCFSYNTEEHYEPFDINVSDIFDSAIVVGVVSAHRW